MQVHVVKGVLIYAHTHTQVHVVLRILINLWYLYSFKSPIRISYGLPGWFVTGACLHLLEMDDLDAPPSRKQELFDILPPDMKCNFIKQIAKDILDKYINLNLSEKLIIGNSCFIFFLLTWCKKLHVHENCLLILDFTYMYNTKGL